MTRHHRLAASMSAYAGAGANQNTYSRVTWAGAIEAVAFVPSSEVITTRSNARILDAGISHAGEPNA